MTETAQTLTFAQAQQRASYIRRMCEDTLRQLREDGEQTRLVLFGPSWFPRTDGRSGGTVVAGWLVAVFLTDDQSRVTSATVLISGLMPTAGRFTAAVRQALNAARKLARED